MSRPPTAAKRDANEPEIRDMLEAFGLSVHQMDRPADLLVGYGGRTYLVEVKMPKGTFTPPQKKFRETWRGDYIVLRTISEAEAFARSVRSGIR